MHGAPHPLPVHPDPGFYVGRRIRGQSSYVCRRHEEIRWNLALILEGAERLHKIMASVPITRERRPDAAGPRHLPVGEDGVNHPHERFGEVMAEGEGVE